ncbi:MAG: hypothetical protein M1827_000112 [Pycnora praestabilis]|nr:MAG: hypothetical protein M1827_000112 [Pycnora praestabilis]
MSETEKDLHVGLCGAGIGGLAAAIAIARAGARVTVLEAASELGEIGAGIQMTPNVARLLIKWGVSDVIGDNLVEFEELNMRRRDGTKVGYTRMMPNVRKELGYPVDQSHFVHGQKAVLIIMTQWWLVHRAHLHQGLVEIARKHGTNLVIDARVTEIDYESGDQVTVTTQAGKSYKFDLLVGSDGLNSVIRRSILPDVKPRAPTGNCAYRAIVPYDQIRKDPIAKELTEKLTMEVWMSDKAYIITYPISAGRDFNLVLSHHRDTLVDHVEDVDIRALQETYKNFDPRIKRIVDMIPEANRWPLLVTGPLKTWSSPQKNVVLIGDAAHSMVNHMAQGAATSMEDGAFLGRTLSEVVKRRISVAEAIHIYEKTRMPKAYVKQQVSFLNGAIWQLPDGPAQEARDKAMLPELRGEPFLRSSNLYGDPEIVLSVYAYDAEADADNAVVAYLLKREPGDVKTGVTKRLEAKFMNWFLPPSEGRGDVREKSRL